MEQVRSKIGASFSNRFMITSSSTILKQESVETNLVQVCVIRSNFLNHEIQNRSESLSKRSYSKENLKEANYDYSNI